MTFLLRFLACLAGIVSFSFSPVCAQAVAPVPSAVFRLFSSSGWQQDLKYDPGASAKPIAVSAGDRPGETYPLPSGGRIVLYRELPVPPDAPAGTLPQKQIAVRISVPERQSRTLIALVPQPDKTFVAHVVDDDPAHKEGGTMRLVNCSTLPAMVGLSDEVHSLSVGETKVVPYRNGATLIRMAVPQNSGWISAFNLERIARPKQFSYGFVFNYVADPDEPISGPPPVAVFRLITETLPTPAGK